MCRTSQSDRTSSRQGSRAWYIASVSLVVLHFYSASSPATANWILLLGSFVGWIVLILVSIVAIVITGARRHNVVLQLRHSFVFLAATFTILLIRADVPLKTRFFLSLPAMNRLVERADSLRESDNDWVGLYPIKDVSTYEGGARFLVRWAGFPVPGGFAYSESGPPPGSEGIDYYQPLHGYWYLWSRIL